ncbi:HNH endonuclease signature motif containing protein [Flexithrix dorotheae]|uniref:HNH endonuclease signature motif containing protein n=1 Tax=Flexithrix dorotheae TaxID=70993 RepID=UPI00036765F7|nr:HNH endonuclease signature motif containing protein [Flexithrix dorotheae]
MSRKKPFVITKAHLAIIKKHGGKLLDREIAEMIGCTRETISRRRRELGIKGKISRFQKGDKPWNTGTKGIMKANSGSFKKGHLPHNTKTDGDISVRKESGTDIHYKYIRVSLGKWELYHRYLWEREHGPIPENMILTFKNGDQMDCRIENLELISLEDNIKRNSGTLNLPDSFVAHLLSRKSKGLKQKLLDNPDILDLARTKILLEREIKSQKNHGKNS